MNEANKRAGIVGALAFVAGMFAQGEIDKPTSKATPPVPLVRPLIPAPTPEPEPRRPANPQPQPCPGPGPCPNPY
jgi:hypothetical protein